ncbi:hypothetical protein Taro_005107 [Colocasia esculenta]|uniref:Uncharacterized protein n=1 Tax=Colocasia esculenta TaxID=4460 RepID=A0A843TTM1_COLES|nr:hypothetical protein [Colocasia esculenta]
MTIEPLSGLVFTNESVITLCREGHLKIWVRPGHTDGSQPISSEAVLSTSASKDRPLTSAVKASSSSFKQPPAILARMRAREVAQAHLCRCLRERHQITETQTRRREDDQTGDSHQRRKRRRERERENAWQGGGDPGAHLRVRSDAVDLAELEVVDGELLLRRPEGDAVRPLHRRRPRPGRAVAVPAAAAAAAAPPLLLLLLRLI